MIDVKIIKKPKNKAATPTVRTPGAAYGDKSVKEAVHASKADTAKMAEKAILAEQAEHAKKADEATRAEKANHAQAANEANHAKLADEVSLESKTLTHFLRNDIPNTAAEVVTFLKGVVAKTMSYFKGIINEGDITNKGNITNEGDITNSGNISNSGDIFNAGNIMTKNLTVTGKATFFELEIQKAKAAGGMTIYSPGAFHIDEVVDTGDYYVCYQRAEQDGVKLMQMCEVGDQLMCARFKVDGNGNKFYWMRVAYASPNTVQRFIDNKSVDYLEIWLDKSVKADNCQGVPEVGDALAVVGNRRNEERQSVIVISAYNSFDLDLSAPYIAQYEHVNNFNLESKKTTWLSKGENHLTGSFTVVSGGKNVSLDDFVTKISQATFKVEADRITARIDRVENETTKKYSELQSTVNSISSTVARKSDLENVRTEIKQTAEEINLSVENGTRPNLLWGSDLNLDGVDTTDKAAIHKHLGVGVAGTKIDSKEWFEYLKGGGVSGADALKFKAMKDIAEFAGLFWEFNAGAARNLQLKPNTLYTLSAWVRTEFDKNAQGYGVFAFEAFKKEKEDSGERVGRLSFKKTDSWFDPINEWTRVSTTFTTEELLYGSVAMWVNGTKPATLWLCHPKLEEGDTATPWCAYDVTADALEQITSIFIKDNKIQLNARNTEVSGDLSVGSLRTTPKVTGDPFIEAHDGEFTIFTFERKKGIDLSVDDSGMPHLIFYDKAGNPAYDLGWTGMKQLTDAVAQEYWSADFLMKEESYTDAKAVSNITRDKCKEYYTYHAAYNRKTGTYGSNEEYNEVTFVEKSFRYQRIADGWYYPVNNGSMARIADERAYIYCTRKFQYSNGKMIGYENVYIEKDTENGAWRFSNYKSGGGRRGGGSIGGGSRGSDSSASSQP